MGTIHNRRFLSFAILASLLALTAVWTPLRADDAPAVAPQTAASSVPYISAAQFDFKTLLPGPPADDSAAHKAEVDRMLSLQESRTPAEVARCTSEEKVTAFAFDTVLGPAFNKKNLPVTAALMKEAYVEAKAVSDQAKKIWNRVRPPIADKRIHPCVALEDTPSYPSGHAVRGMLWATLLAEIYPDQRAALMARGKQIGDDRFLAGMHYPSDVAGGQILGAEIAKMLLANPAFLAKLDQAKAECLAEAPAKH
jgi:acid phosphatase (class A)